MKIDALVDRFALDAVNKQPAVFVHDKLEALKLERLSRTAASESSSLEGAAAGRSGWRLGCRIETRRDWWDERSTS
jgi:hypothetical protein